MITIFPLDQGYPTSDPPGQTSRPISSRERGIIRRVASLNLVNKISLETCNYRIKVEGPTEAEK